MTSLGFPRLPRQGRQLKYERLNDEPPRLRPRKAPKKEVALALFLFTCGILFILTGLNVFWTENFFDSVPFTMLGCICFIPGAYHTYICYHVWRGTEGFSWTMIPNMD